MNEVINVIVFVSLVGRMRYSVVLQEGCNIGRMTTTIDRTTKGLFSRRNEKSPTVVTHSKNDFQTLKPKRPSVFSRDSFWFLEHECSVATTTVVLSHIFFHTSHQPHHPSKHTREAFRFTDNKTTLFPTVHPSLPLLVA